MEAIDAAPERGVWEYALVNKPPVHLVAGVVTARPGRPVHGRRFTIRRARAALGHARARRVCKLTCIVRAGLTGAARLLPARGSLRNGRAGAP